LVLKTTPVEIEVLAKRVAQVMSVALIIPVDKLVKTPLTVLELVLNTAPVEIEVLAKIVPEVMELLLKLLVETLVKILFMEV
jgi:hypothetical protein